MEGCACACLHRRLQLLTGELWPSPDLGLEAREVGRRKSREEPGPTPATGAQGRSEQTGWGAGVRGPSGHVACGGLPLSSEAQESPSWQGARGRTQPARRGHLLSLAPASPRGPGGCREEAVSLDPSRVQGAAGRPGQLLPPASESSTR